MKIAQNNSSQLRRSDLFVENRSAQDSKLRRSGIFRRRADVAPTELNDFLMAGATNMPLLRSYETGRFFRGGSTQVNPGQPRSTQIIYKNIEVWRAHSPQPRWGWGSFQRLTQGSAYRATLGWRTQSRWDCRMMARAFHEPDCQCSEHQVMRPMICQMCACRLPVGDTADKTVCATTVRGQFKFTAREQVQSEEGTAKLTLPWSYETGRVSGAVGTAEPMWQFQPSLRDSTFFASQPGVETPGYCRPSLRDENPRPSGVSGSTGRAGSQPVTPSNTQSHQIFCKIVGKAVSGAPSGRENLFDDFLGYRFARPQANGRQPFRLLLGSCETARFSRGESQPVAASRSQSQQIFLKNVVGAESNFRKNESQGDSGAKPKVARHGQSPQPRWGWRNSCRVTQGSAGRATPGWRTQSRWDCRRND